MAETPPSHFIKWATSGGADKTEPSDAQIRTGFRTGITTDFNSMLNYTMNLQSRWSDFIGRVHAPEFARRNIEWTDNSPFGTGLAAIHIRYDDQADKWYCVGADLASSANIDCYDSDDGVTWSAAKRVVTADCNDENCSAIWSSGTKCAMVAASHGGPSSKMYISTDNTVANMVAMSGSFNNIVYATDLLYDQDSSRWFVVGRNAALTAGYIESSGDDGATWTLEYTSTNNLRSIATDQNGDAICIADDSGQVVYCTAGLTGAWNIGGVASYTSNKEAHFLPFMGTFGSYVWVSSSGSLNLLRGDAMGSNPLDTDYDMDMCLYSDDLVIFEGDTGTRSTNYDLYTMRRGAVPNDAFIMETLGALKYDVALDWDLDATFGGGKGTFIFTYGASDKLAIMRYGPQGT